MASHVLLNGILSNGKETTSGNEWRKRKKPPSCGPLPLLRCDLLTTALPHAREHSQITACPPFSLLNTAGTEHPLFDPSFSLYSLCFRFLTQTYVRNYQSHCLPGARPSPRVSHHYKPLSSSYMSSYFPGRYFSHLSVENLEKLH